MSFIFETSIKKIHSIELKTKLSNRYNQSVGVQVHKYSSLINNVHNIVKDISSIQRMCGKVNNLYLGQ